MKPLPLIATLLLTAAAVMLLFYAVVRPIATLWLDVTLRPEVREALKRSADDQKRLRALDPANADEYRRRFDVAQKLMNRLEVISLNREAMTHRIELALVAAFACIAVLAGVIASARQHASRQRERFEFIERLRSWQDTARRHAHEIKGPLSAARLELERAAELTASGAPGSDIMAAHESVSEELERLTRFTRDFSSLSAVSAPVMHRQSLSEITREFCRTFANAWPNLELHEPAGGDAMICADRDLLRQVLVNLCGNSAAATSGGIEVTFVVRRNGSRIALDVSDNGPGIPASLKPRIFDPYVTSRRIGEGMGLGLAISRKILLDHGGDLILMESSPLGTTFRLTFPAATEQACL